MPRHLSLIVADEIVAAAQERARQEGTTIAHVLRRALGEAFDVDHRTLFQVSTSGAIVEGLYDGCVSIGELRSHGDFGLGTFEGLDGEMVMLDGRCYRARGENDVTEPDPVELTPFAVVTNFVADRRVSLGTVTSVADLEQQLDPHRLGDNLFVAIRIDGTFDALRLRAACRTDGSVPLLEATANQREWTLEGATGTLVGFWSPVYARSIAVAGYHLHFLSDDHTSAGHVLDVSSHTTLEVALHDVHDLRVALPETAEFVRADLSADPTAALDVAEHSRTPPGT